MPLADLLPLHQQDFQALAATWLRLGADSVCLLENGQVIAAYPLKQSQDGQKLVARDAATGLELHLYGVNNHQWQSNAEMQVKLFGRMLTSENEMEALTASLVETQDRLVALYDLTRATRRAIEVDDLLALLTVESSRLLDASGAFAVVYLPGQAPIVRQHHSQKALPEAHLLAAATLYRRDPNRRTFKDGGTLPVGMRNVIMSSLPVRDQVFACLGVFNKSGDFTAPDGKLLKAITDQAGAKLDNALLYQEAIQRARIDAEMNLARQVQTALLPQTLPKLDGIDIHAVSIPALEVGGDFFDVAAMPNRPLVFLLGDVTGKGLPAALLMSMTHTVAHSAVRYMPFVAPHQVLDRLNKDMLDDYSAVGMFTTAFVGTLDLPSRKLMYSNAGQSPILYASPTHQPQLLEAADIPVGVFDGYTYTSHSIQLSLGDVLVAMTDGFNESRNEAGEMFGIERLKDELQKLQRGSAREIADGLLAAISTFAGNHPQDDDRTLVVLKITSEKGITAMQTNLTISAQYEQLRLPAAALRELGTRAGAPEEIIGLCELALQELLTNLVDHAYGKGLAGQIHINIRVEPAHIQIKTEDSGQPAQINLDSVSMPDPGALMEGGYGMAIIKNLMDDVSYRRENDLNTWVLTRRW